MFPNGPGSFLPTSFSNAPYPNYYQMGPTRRFLPSFGGLGRSFGLRGVGQILALAPLMIAGSLVVRPGLMNSILPGWQSSIGPWLVVLLAFAVLRAFFSCFVAGTKILLSLAALFLIGREVAGGGSLFGAQPRREALAVVAPAPRDSGSNGWDSTWWGSAEKAAASLAASVTHAPASKSAVEGSGRSSDSGFVGQLGSLFDNLFSSVGVPSVSSLGDGIIAPKESWASPRERGVLPDEAFFPPQRGKSGF